MEVWPVPCLPFQGLRESFSVSIPNMKVKQKPKVPLEPHSAGFPRNKRLFLLPVRLGWLLALSYFYPSFLSSDFDLQEILEDCCLILFRLPKSKSIGWGLISNRDLFLTVLQTRQAKLEVPACSVPDTSCFLGHRQAASHCNPIWQKRHGTSLGSIFRKP